MLSANYLNPACESFVMSALGAPERITEVIDPK